jgi:hypothetical protein
VRDRTGLVARRDVPDPTDVTGAVVLRKYCATCWASGTPLTCGLCGPGESYATARAGPTPGPGAVHGGGRCRPCGGPGAAGVVRTGSSAPVRGLFAGAAGVVRAGARGRPALRPGYLPAQEAGVVSPLGSLASFGGLLGSAFRNPSSSPFAHVTVNMHG